MKMHCCKLEDFLDREIIDYGILFHDLFGGEGKRILVFLVVKLC